MKRAELVQQIIESLARCQRVATPPSEWKEIGLSHAQVGVLFMIRHHDCANVKQLSEHLGVTKSAITQLVDPLVIKGFIERQADKEDRRIVRFTITEKGMQILKQISSLKFTNMRTALNTLSDEELQQLARLHKKAIENLNNQFSKNGI
jgi:DNA-binding MarR family transcriptional regulator